MDAPLIVTLTLDTKSQEYFDALRDKHFPKHINYLKAHCSLFHKLPAGERDIQEILSDASKRRAFTMDVDAVNNIGNGVVYSIRSEILQALHLYLQDAFEPWLINQDRQKLKPHITVQNKVTAFKAATLCELLRSEFTPFAITATGFSTWLYLNGPWQHVGDFLFQ